MKPSVYTYNAHEINDGTNYTAHMLLENQGQGSAEVTNVKRPFNRPVYGGKTLNNYEMVLLIHMLGTWQTQVDTLKGWFDVEDQTQHALIIKDTNNSNKQWFVMATTRKCVLLNNTTMVVTLDVADPVWMAVSESSSGSWGVTASGQTWSVTAGGNVNARPRITITPTAVKGSGFAYKRLCIVRNRVSEDLVNYPFELTNAGWDATALLNYTTNHVHINNGAGIAADTVTIPYDGEEGTLPTSGLAMIENEQIRYTGKAGGNLTGVTRGVNGTTAATHADDVQINQSLIQADGNDIRVYVDGKMVPCWTYGVGTSAQKVWIAQDWKKKIDLTLTTAVNDTDTSLVLNSTTKLPSKGLVLIGTELIRYTAKADNTATLSGCTRGACGTSAASHTKNTATYWIEHEIWIYYGNINLDDPSTNYEDWDNHKPIFSLNSTNTSWVYATFKDRTGQRAGSFVPTVPSTTNKNTTAAIRTKAYTGARSAMVATATEMGAIIAAWKSGATWKGDNATVLWSYTNPCGFTTVTASGEKYRATTDWPSTAYCEYSDDGENWSAAWTTEATPKSAGSWYALASHASVSLSGTYPYIRFTFDGSVGATANNYAAISYTDLTLVPDTNYIPLATLGSETSNYHLNIKITNSTTGESLKLDTGMLLNGTLELDCKDKTVTVTSADSEKDTDKASAVYGYSSVRNQWLDLQPGANTLKIDDIETTGTLQMTVYIYWQDRNS